MNTVIDARNPGASSHPQGRTLPRTAAFFLMASITVSFLAGSIAPTPLYATYQAQWGFSALTVSVIFGIYAIAVLLALLVAGRLSDHVGRRPVLLAALLGQIPVMALFAFAHSVGDLVLARVLQGLITGFAMGAIGAGMLDIDREKGATANAVAPGFGTASGALLAGILVQYLPAPTHLVYGVMAAVYVLQAIGVWFIPETVSPQSGAFASLVPQFAIPTQARGPLLLALPVIVAAWALSGFYGSLGPMLVKNLAGNGSPLLGGLTLFVLTGSGGSAVLLLQRRPPLFMMLLGASLLAAGVTTDLVAIQLRSIGLFMAGTAVAGMGFGTGFQGAVRTVVQFAAPHERSGLVSIVFIAAYVAMGMPAVIAGARVARHGDISSTSEHFGTVVIGLALMVIVMQVVRYAVRQLRATCATAT